MIDRGKFYHGPEGVCRALFGGRLNQGQVSTMEALVDEWERRVAAKEAPASQLDWLAYIMATDLRECGVGMVPVRETFADSDAQARRRLAGVWYARPSPITGLSYYGRGIVQLTHYNNYLTMNRIKERVRAAKDSPWASVLPAADLTLEPDVALQLPVAVWVTFEGMLKADSHAGDFTGVALEDFTRGGRLDLVNARRVVNGLDHAQEIAGNAELFLRALRAAQAKGGK